MELHIKCYVGVNKDKTVQMFTSPPKRNMEKCIWESDNIYINSRIYQEVIKMMNNAELTWDNDYEYFDFNIVYQIYPGHHQIINVIKL